MLQSVLSLRYTTVSDPTSNNNKKKRCLDPFLFLEHRWLSKAKAQQRLSSDVMKGRTYGQGHVAKTALSMLL